MIGTKQIPHGQIETYTTADVADSVGKRYQTENQNTFNDSTSSIQTQLNTKQTYLVKNSVPTSAITGTTSLTQIGSSILIPANTFSANDVMRLESFGIFKTGVAGTLTFRFHVNTVDNLSTATLLSSAFCITTQISANKQRTFELNGGLIKSRFGTSATFTDYAASTIQLSASFNPAVDNYLFTSVQLTNSADSVIRTQLIITK